VTPEAGRIEGRARGARSNGAAAHPVRFDPTRSAGTLMESEHLARYHWAAQLVAGHSVLDAACGTGYGTRILARAGARRVTGVDLDAQTVAIADQRYGTEGLEFLEGDLSALELPEDSFDLVVCFEAIEHLGDPAAAVAELRRLVRPGGTLVVSSPNPAAYPQGNPHHLHELAPTELLGLVESHFDNTVLHLQHAWLASLIESAGAEAAGTRFRRVRRRTPEQATFGIVIGSDAGLEPMAGFLNLGDPFEVGWWEGQVAAAASRGRAGAAEGNGGDPTAGLAARLEQVEAAAAGRLQEAEGALTAAEARLQRQEREAARALLCAEERERRAQARLKDTGAALLEASQELAEAPLLKHRLAELYRENTELEAFRQSLLGSRSWRCTAPLRGLAAFLRPTR
jgi:2-polyprenyl-3-methyl-5-hydroxy-6-metoxy-1,4-benzoquinol methylase